ncbi:hypothetical protein HYPSUDRAFT_678434 [Hypholoma sublateritium FD-334 SS-4]|uniref:Secreted protein n=1 Tax=Hypholoma sublateritium (strain FD-334 SS-4) TaxID=945553 RepID=A0A0D2NZ78_HYPSF|nr:hypothetical protein HYPSUDRAFT_678434 [Hypholoma sublateritium FD-334 SS-4]
MAAALISFNLNHYLLASAFPIALSIRLVSAEVMDFTMHSSAHEKFPRIPVVDLDAAVPKICASYARGCHRVHSSGISNDAGGLTWLVSRTRTVQFIVGTVLPPLLHRNKRENSQSVSTERAICIMGGRLPF